MPKYLDSHSPPQGHVMATLVDEKITALLDDLQVGSGFIGGRRKRALRKFSIFYHEHEPSLSMAQVYLILIGDEDQPGRIGLVQMCGMKQKSKRKKGVEKDSFTRSAFVALDFLYQILCLSEELPSTPVLREVYASLPLAAINHMKLDDHILNTKTKRWAFQLVYLLMSEQAHLKKDTEGFVPFELDQILLDADAFDMYLDWEDRVDRDDGGFSDDEDQRPSEWWDVVILDDDLDFLKTDTLFGSNHPNKKDSMSRSMIARISEGASFSFEGGAEQKANSEFYDPLGINMTFNVKDAIDPSFKTRIPLTIKTNHLNVPGIQKDNELSDTQSLSPTSLSSNSLASDQHSFSKRRSKLSRLSQKLGLKGSPKSRSNGEKKKFFSFHHREINQSSAFPSNIPEAEELTDNHDAGNSRKEPAHSDNSVGVYHHNIGSPRAKHKPRASVLLNSESFDPGLFLWRVHHDSKLDDLKRGLKNLEEKNKSQNDTLKALVQENFDEFVHCRHTIEQIDKLMHQEIKPAAVATKNNRTKPLWNTRNVSKVKERASKSRIAEVEGSIKSAEETVSDHFEPLLEKRRRIRRLKRAKELLKRFEHLWLLPHQLSDLIDKGEWVKAAVRFRDACHHLGTLHELDKKNSSDDPDDNGFENAKATNDTNSGEADFYKSAMHELEDCGEKLTNSLLEMLKIPVDNPEKFIEENKDLFVEPLDPYDALSLLLEMREHVPKSSRISSLLVGEDKDPFLILLKCQTKNTVSSLEHVRHQYPSDSDLSGKELIKVVEDVSFATKKSLDLWKRVVDGLDVSLHHLTPTSPQTPSVPNTVKHIEISSTVADMYESHKEGKFSQLDEIRRRSISNCNFEDLSVRRATADTMSLAITTVYSDTISHLFRLNKDSSDYVELISILFSFCLYLRNNGVIDASLRSRKRSVRLSRKLSVESDGVSLEEDTENAAEDNDEDLYMIVDCMQDLTELCILKMFDGTKIALELGDEAGEARTLKEVEIIGKNIFEQVAGILKSGSDIKIWYSNFLERLWEPSLSFLIWYMENVCEWIGMLAKRTTTTKLLKLVADSTYCRTELLSILWDSIVNMELKRSKRDMDKEAECYDINKQFLRLENALLAQYIKQHMLPLKELLTMNFEPSEYISDPGTNVRIRPYVLEILLRLATSISNCRECGLDGSRIMFGLYNRIAVHMQTYILSSSATFTVPEARQLELDMEFIRNTLKKYETTETWKAMTSAINGVKKKTSLADSAEDTKRNSLEQWDVIKENALKDASNKSSLLIKCFVSS